MAGNSVDVVGDALFLSRFMCLSQFSVVVSLAVFDHIQSGHVLWSRRLLESWGWRRCGYRSPCFLCGVQAAIEFLMVTSKPLAVLSREALFFEAIDKGIDGPMIGGFFWWRSCFFCGAPVSGLYCHFAYRQNGSRVACAGPTLFA